MYEYDTIIIVKHKVLFALCFSVHSPEEMGGLYKRAMADAQKDRALFYKADGRNIESFLRQEELFIIHTFLKCIEYIDNNWEQILEEIKTEQKHKVTMNIMSMIMCIEAMHDCVLEDVRSIVDHDHDLLNDFFKRIDECGNGNTEYVKSKKELLLPIFLQTESLLSALKTPDSTPKVLESFCNELSKIKCDNLTQCDLSLYEVILHTTQCALAFTQLTEARKSGGLLVGEAFNLSLLIIDSLPKIVKNTETLLETYCNDKSVPQEQREWGKKIVSSFHKKIDVLINPASPKWPKYLCVTMIASVFILVGISVYSSQKKKKTNLV